MDYVDQMNSKVVLEASPQRIVSLVPSQTELLFHLGLGDRVVGITKFCLHPEEWFRGKARVGGTKNADYHKVQALQPDLILGNKEENDKDNIEELRGLAPVWMSEIKDLEEALEMISKIAALCHVEEAAKGMIDEIKKNFSALRPLQGKSALYFIWRNPWMAAGSDTFIHHMLELCGLRNLCTETRYPQVELGQSEQPDYVFLSSEPYPFKEKHIEEVQKAYPKAKVLLVDGEMFSWYGSRLLKAPDYFQALIDSV
jgi:iron complex transport system substrate-binding protein